MQEIYRQIDAMEKELERAKSHFNLGKVSLDFSKKRILQLERHRSHLLSKLPDHEREMYLMRKELNRFS